jgi:hypothetical protein
MKPAGAEVVGEMFIERLDDMRFKVSPTFIHGGAPDERMTAHIQFRKDGKMDFIIAVPRDTLEKHFRKLEAIGEKVGEAGARYMLISWRTACRYIELVISDDPPGRGGHDDLPDVLVDATERTVTT